jgi:hypothetical protein
MNRLKFYIVLCVIILASCKNNPKKSEESCAYQELSSKSSITETSNGHKLNIEVEGKIMANLKKLADIEGRAKANDSIYIDVEKSIKKKDVTYPTDFLQTHNAIIQILCDIETQLKDATLTPTDKSRLLNDKIEKRTIYFNFLLGKKIDLSDDLPKTNSGNIDNQESEKTKKSTNPIAEYSSWDMFYDKNSKCSVAILATTEYQKLNLKNGSKISEFLNSKGLTNNTLFFKPTFLSKFSNQFKGNDYSIFNALGIDKNVGCVCLIDESNLKIELMTDESIPYKKASADYKIVMFSLNGGSPQTFQIESLGAGVSDALAKESLTDNFNNSFKNLSINFNLCKQ